MQINTLYEDKNILVINKPAGLLVYPIKDQGLKTKDKTLVDWILKNYPEIKGVGEPMVLSDGTHIEKPGIVHRLDKDTSGVMLIAKNQETFEFLKKQFSAASRSASGGQVANEPRVKKVYQAIVWGDIKEDKGKIDKPIGRSPSTGHFLSGRGARGKMREAVTEYKVIKRFSVETENLNFQFPRLRRGFGRQAISNFQTNSKSKIQNKLEKSSFTFLEVYPKTGRTHQIRVHLKYINHPIICDKIYASNMPCPVLGLNRLALHAASIEFSLPGNKHMKLEASLPEEMRKVISNRY
jgi:23S rRNA pseudouridine1911/1915/1917 synthase